MHPHAHLAFAGMRFFQLKDLEHFRTAESAESNRAHPRHPTIARNLMVLSTFATVALT